MRINSIAFRLMAGAALWLGLALAAAGFVLSAMFGDHIRTGFERRIGFLLDSLIAVSEIDGAGAVQLARAPGEPLFDQPYSGWYWQITVGGKVELSSRSLWDVELPVAAAASPARTEVAGPRGQRLLVTYRSISLPGASSRRMYAVAADLAVLEAERRPFGRTLALSLGVLWLGLMIAVFVQVRFGLRPLGRIQSALADIRAGREERMPGDLPSEIAPIAKELNIHLEHVANIVERARTHVGNMAHALKTPLSVLTNEAGQAEGDLADTVRRQSDLMRRRVDHYLVRARTAATGGLIGARTEMKPVLDDLSRTLARIHRERDLQISITAGEPVFFRGDRQDVEEIAGNILDNACKWANRQVAVSLRRQGDVLVLTVGDDGPGLPPERRSEALSPGARLDESVPGTGFGLAIVAEIAGLYGGSVSLGESPLGGLQICVRLPAVEG